MQRQFTPAVYRALTEAAAWASRDRSDEVHVPELLLGLLAEPECRAAAMLAKHAVDPDAVRRRWPELARIGPPAGETGEPAPQADWDPVTRKPLDSDVEAAVEAAASRMAPFAEPVVLATEHLLLGILCCQSEAAGWLATRGLNAEVVAAEIGRIYGYPVEAASGHRPEEGVPLEIPENLGPSEPPPTQPEDPVAKAQSAERAPPTVGPEQHAPLLRILDAAANRAREGLRVVEDYVRFVLDDRHLTGRLKQLRHNLAAALQEAPVRARLAARETQADVGTTLSTPAEERRADAAVVLTANFVRLQEGLRSLEEFGKILSPQMAARIKALRYDAYTLQRAVEITRDAVDRLAGARLYVLVDGQPTQEKFRQLVGQLIEAGVYLIQLRDKKLDDRRLLERARLLRELTRGTPTLAIINDRPDLAVLAGADGVQVGQEELSVKDARTIVGTGALVGVSTHSIQQARQAVLDGANYIGVGPTFPSGTKQFDEFPGPELLRAVAKEIRLPAFAIGGITLENLPAVLQTGIRRVAVSGAILLADDPGYAARQLLAALNDEGN